MLISLGLWKIGNTGLIISPAILTLASGLGQCVRSKNNRLYFLGFGKYGLFIFMQYRNCPTRKLMRTRGHLVMYMMVPQRRLLCITACTYVRALCFRDSAMLGREALESRIYCSYR